jgi:hypothetical protein
MENNQQVRQPTDSRQVYEKPLLLEENAFVLITGASPPPFNGFLPNQQEGEA